ncbi:MAG TPA: FAD-dependent thymidylate synthase [Isosphaeraceae bacterium]|jgi:thymidylate synthase (FAD)
MATMNLEPRTTVLRDPRVYLVGRQEIGEADLARFLADEGVERWTTDTEVAGQKLVEVAGRLCYTSYARPRPGGNAAYIGHILEVGHGSVLEHAVFNFIITGVSRSLTHELVRHRAGWSYCLAADTLIYSDHRCNGKREGTQKRTIESIYWKQMTPHGRSRLRLLRPRCLDESAGQFTNGRIKSIARSGLREVFRVVLEDGKTVTCSGDHKFLTPDGWMRLEEIVGGIRVTSRLAVAHGPLTTPIAVNGIPAYQSREWLQKQYHDQGRSRAEIAAECGVAEITVRQWIRRHRLTKPIGSWSVGRRPWNKNRKYKGGWKHSVATRGTLSAQKQGALNPSWRGGITPEGHRLRDEAKDLHPAVRARDEYRCRLCGRGGTLEIHHILPISARPDLNAAIDNLAAVCVPCHDAMAGRELEFVERFGASPPPPETIRPRKKTGGQILAPRWRSISRIEYAGIQMTYDLEMDGPNHNFVANGIVTHNSQLSQRFVDESECNFVEPDSIAEDPDLHAIWLQAIATCQRAYQELADALTAKFAHLDDKTLRRKRAREAARSVLPNATETKIFVTANARALRNFLELRGSRHADAEIRKVAREILRVLQAEAPHIVPDFQVVELGGSEWEITNTFKKV